jgi:hypothetical protein
MISYIKALDFKLREGSKYSKKAAITAYVATYLITPLAMLCSPYGFLPLLALFLLLHFFVIQNIRKDIASSANIAAAGLTYLWISIILITTGLAGVWDLSHRTSMNDLMIVTGSQPSDPQINPEMLKKVLFAFAMSMIAIGSFLLPTGNYIVGKKLKIKSIKGIKTSEIFASEKRGGLKPLPIALSITAKVYGYACVAVVLSSILALFIAPNISVVLGLFNWVCLAPLYYLAYSGKTLSNIPTNLFRALSVAVVLLDISIIAGLWGDPIAQINMSDRLLNLALSLPIYMAALWYSFLYLPGAKKVYSNKEIFV